MTRLAIVAQWLSLAAILALFAAVLAGRVPAQPTHTPLSDAIARVAANESSLSAARPADVALIHQVTEAHGSTPAARLAWLQRHSDCVLTDRPLTDRERRGNCPLSRSLPLDGQPWPATIARRYRSRWAQIRDLAARLVDGRLVLRPCAEQPTTWGGPMDRERAIRLGMRALDCRDPATGEPLGNDGFTWAARGVGPRPAAQRGAGDES